MSPVFAVLLVSVVAVLAKPNDHSVNDEHSRQIVEKCNEEVKAPANAVDHILKMEKLDESKEGKCLVKCVFNHIGIMDAEGHVHHDKSDDYIKEAYNKPENQKKAVEIVEECIKKTEKDEDQCEHAYDLLECIIDESKEKHLPPVHHD